MGADTRRSRLSFFPECLAPYRDRDFVFFMNGFCSRSGNASGMPNLQKSISAAGCNAEERPFQGGVAIQTRTGFSPSGRLCRTFFRPFGA